MHSQSIRSVRAFSTDAKNSLRSCWELQCRKLECCVKDDYIPGVELRALLMKEAACRHLQHGTLVLSPRATGTGPANLSIVRALCMFASRSHPPLPAHSRTALKTASSRVRNSQGQAPLSEQEVDELLLFADPAGQGLRVSGVSGGFRRCFAGTSSVQPGSIH